jgi:hypothetical protein
MTRRSLDNKSNRVDFFTNFELRTGLSLTASQEGVKMNYAMGAAHAASR